MQWITKRTNREHRYDLVDNMDKVENPYLAVLDRVHLLDRSIHILTLVNHDLRHILHKHKPLPQFVQDSFKRAPISRSKTSPALPPPTPVESEEVRLAANILDKAKRTIENISEKKPKQISAATPSISTSTQQAPTQISRSKSSSSIRPASSNASVPSAADSSTPQPPPGVVRRFMPAHMKAPFLTQPEKKRRSGSSVRSSTQTNANPKTSTVGRSLSQQRRQSQSSFAINQSTVEFPPQSTRPAPVLAASHMQQETNLMTDYETTEETPVDEPSNHHPSESPEMDGTAIPPEPIILNRALVKPLRRVWKQNQNLRLRLQRELEKKPLPSPAFINRLNEQIHSTSDTDEMHVSTVDVLLLLATKLRAIILHLLENSPFDDLESALKRLHTLKYLVNQYQFLSSGNLNVLVAKQLSRSKPIRLNNEEWLNPSKSVVPKKATVRYTDDSQLIAFTEVRFQKFETESRWLELNWHEQMIQRFKQTLASKDHNPLQLYRELMSLITGLQTSTPIVVENRN